MWLIIILIIILSLLYLTKSKKSPKSYNNQTTTDTQTYLPYKLKYILTKNEYYFYNILKPITDRHNYLICPKIGIKDIVDVTDHRNYMKYFKKISQKHIDFIICDNNLKPLYGIELDDKSHEKEKAFKNDNFKNLLFNEIGLKLIRIKSNNYDNLENVLFPQNIE